nr:MAG TPA: hypothetical protein [Bacteriophage sp.]
MREKAREENLSEERFSLPRAPSFPKTFIWRSIRWMRN